ncbi:MAG: type III secretion protein [Lachnospiraceae bacterium]|jgi:flagellar biosynthesis protein|nr:type III secretion protein [Lachnospiraceae bacterium]
MSRFNEVMNKKAVALKYDENRNAAPVIVASGMGYLAEKIVEVANDNGVPVYEDNSLATVLTQLNLGAEIPEELYQAVVDIYAYFLKFVPKEPQGAAVEDSGEERTTEADSGASQEEG